MDELWIEEARDMAEKSAFDFLTEHGGLTKKQAEDQIFEDLRIIRLTNHYTSANRILATILTQYAMFGATFGDPAAVSSCQKMADLYEKNDGSFGAEMAAQLRRVASAEPVRPDHPGALKGAPMQNIRAAIHKTFG